MRIGNSSQEPCQPLPTAATFAVFGIGGKFPQPLEFAELTARELAVSVFLLDLGGAGYAATIH